MSVFHIYNGQYAGRCFWSEKRGRVSSVFTYDNDYLSGGRNWSIDPSLALVSGAQPAPNGLPGAFCDASPDRWGRNLIAHRFLREHKEREDARKKSRSLNDVDYLLGVSDFARQGNLRFSLEKGGVFEHPQNDIPKLLALPKLLQSAREYIADENEGAIAYLLDAGSASLGGARPKAAVLDGDRLLIAKFPHRQDAWDVIAWEWVALCVAEEAGIRAPIRRLVQAEGQNVLLLDRFDRIGGQRLGYISAMTMLSLVDGNQADYADIAAGLRDVSVCAKEDLRELFRRIAFSLAINNTDDHLRNHGLLQEGSGWRLSPIFDVNPTPGKAMARATGVFGEIFREPALAALKEHADAFDLTLGAAEKIMREVSKAAKSVRKYADAAGIKPSEQTLFREAFLS
jgi:serine/threonine-protein kinase HipA